MILEPIPNPGVGDMENTMSFVEMERTPLFAEMVTSTLFEEKEYSAPLTEAMSSSPLSGTREMVSSLPYRELHLLWGRARC